MKVSDILSRPGRQMSFEVFPPKTDATLESVKKATEAVAALQPAFVSVTYGAGGGTRAYTLDIAENMLKKYGTSVVTHLTCVASDREFVRERIAAMRRAGLENVMALRGDVPPALKDADRSRWDYRYAAELVRDLKAAGGFCIGGACYPEVHPESPDPETDIRHLKEKVNEGCDFLTTQMVFDNEIFLRFLDRARDAGIEVPILPGIMPITAAVQVKRAVELSGSYVPAPMLQAAERYADAPEDMKKFGLDFAAEQIGKLYEAGVRTIHVYTMNKADVAAELQKRTLG